MNFLKFFSVNFTEGDFEGCGFFVDKTNFTLPSCRASMKCVKASLLPSIFI